MNSSQELNLVVCSAMIKPVRVIFFYKLRTWLDQVADIVVHTFAVEESKLPVHGELILKPLREAERSLGSEFANGSLSTLLAIWECFQQFQPAYDRRVSYECDDDCNRLGSL